MQNYAFKITCLLLLLSVFAVLRGDENSRIQTFKVSLENYERLKRVPSLRKIGFLEKQTYESINKIRVQFGLVPLILNKNLFQIAKIHSKQMALEKVPFGHEGVSERSKKVLETKKHDFFGENVAYTYLAENPLQMSIDGWMDSPGHRKNILGDFNETGIGIVYSKEGRCYLTQIFARKATHAY